MMKVLCFRLGLLLLLIGLAGTILHAEETVLDGNIRRVAGQHDLGWIYCPYPVCICGKSYAGYGYIADRARYHADGWVSLNVNGWYEFTALAGFADCYGAQCGVVTIEVDGQKVFSRVMRSGDAPVPIAISLLRVRNLTIDMQGSGILAQPRLIRISATTFIP